MRRLAATALLAAAALAGAPRSQSVRRVDWGFDGTAVPGRFNLLSVLVDNPTETPLETELVLTRRTTMGGQLGAPIVKPCYVAPRSQRWVQFTPYVTSRRQPWNVRFAREELAGAEVPRPAAGPPALVLLDVESLESALSYLLPVFPVERFPATVTATDGLGGVVLDRIPDWERPRRAAFLDWVRGGGTVHLLRGYGGWPRFTDDLAALDGPGLVTRVGSGRVVRHEYTRDELRRRVPPDLGVTAPDGIEGVEAVVSGGLQSQIHVAHEWWMINLLALAYVGAVGPLVLRLARRGATWPRVLGVLAVVIAVASVAFSLAGARGVGEQTVVHSMTYARPLDDGRWSVVQYANAFVTRGGEYVIARDGDGDAFSTAQVHEAVRGMITEGPDARLVVDMPQFSWRSFVHQRVKEAPAYAVEPGTDPRQPGSVGPSFTVPDTPSPPVRRLLGGLCVSDGRVWALRAAGRRLDPSSGARPFANVETVVTQLVESLPEDVVRTHAALAPIVTAIVTDRTALEPGRDRAVLYVLAEPVDELGVHADGLGADAALALFRFDVARDGR